MIILARHGEATHHTLKLTGGWTDSDLTERGERQIAALAVRLTQDFAGRRDFSLRLLASDLKRAAQSAQIIARALERVELKIQPEYYSFLREKNNGTAAGLTEEAAKQLYCGSLNARDIDHRNYPGGETRNEFYWRNIKGLAAVADWEKENLLIVAHKGTIQNLIFAWLGLTMADVAAQNFSVDIAPASVSVLGINKWHEHTIFLLNDSLPATQAGYGLFQFKYDYK